MRAQRETVPSRLARSAPSAGKVARLAAIPLLALALGSPVPSDVVAEDGGAEMTFPGRPDPAPLLGTPAPPLDVDAWLDPGGETWESLEGRVRLVRWWTDTCPFCASSAPSLRAIHERYAERGLAVVGVFHPKPPAALDRERARRAAERFRFEFPIAIDTDWDAMRAWWLDRIDGGWTSVTFVVDRRGTIRWIHPGGEYHEGEGGANWSDHATCRAELDALIGVIESLLAEEGDRP